MLDVTVLWKGLTEFKQSIIVRARECCDHYAPPESFRTVYAYVALRVVIAVTALGTICCICVREELNWF